MTTETKSVEVQANWSGRGQYDMPCETRLVKRDEKHYLVHDCWSGVDQLRGEQYRPFIFFVPPVRVREVADLVANGDEWSDVYASPTRKRTALLCDVLGDLPSLGEQRSTGWMSEL